MCTFLLRWVFCTDTANQMAGMAKRVSKLVDTLQELEKARSSAKHAAFQAGAGDRIAFDGVEVRTPTGKVLVQDLSKLLQQQTNL